MARALAERRGTIGSGGFLGTMARSAPWECGLGEGSDYTSR